jgi:hypothetical protein
MPWTLYSTGTITVFGNAVNTIPFSPAPILDATSSVAIEITLTGDVVSSSFVSGAGPGFIQLVVFYILQDAAGGHKWAWPGNFHGCQNVDNVNLSMAPNQVMVQSVYWSGGRATATAASPMILYP